MALPAHDARMADDPNARIQRQMALLFPFISLTYGSLLPAGLFLYWIVSTLFSIVQQYLIIGWGGMFPFFGWTPGFAEDHTPRFPVDAATPAPSRRSGRRSPPSADRPSVSGRRSRQDHSPPRTRPPEPPRETTMSAYKEFTGKTVEEALRSAREEFGVELSDLDFEILTPGSRGVLGMGAEPARIVAAPRSALGGAAPKREAAAATPLPPAAAARGPRRDRAGDRGGPRRPWPAPRRPRRAIAATAARGRDDRPAATALPAGAPTADGAAAARPPTGRAPAPARRPRWRPGRRAATTAARAATSAPRRPVLNADEAAEVAAARGSVAAERAELEAAEASPEALAAGKEILEELMRHLGLRRPDRGRDRRHEPPQRRRQRRRATRRSARSSAARASACRRSSTSST